MTACLPVLHLPHSCSNVWSTFLRRCTFRARLRSRQVPPCLRSSRPRLRARPMVLVPVPVPLLRLILKPLMFQCLFVEFVQSSPALRLKGGYRGLCKIILLNLLLEQILQSPYLSREFLEPFFCGISVLSLAVLFVPLGNKISSTLTCSPLAFNTIVHAVCRVPLRFVHLQGRLSVFLNLDWSEVSSSLKLFDPTRLLVATPSSSDRL